MPDPAPPKEFKFLQKPTQCALWKDPARVTGRVAEHFEIVETFVDESHLNRALLKCRECGQLYFFENYEHVDWKDGDDPLYSTYIPVRTREEIDTLKAGSIYDLLCFFPRLQWDFASAKGETARWVDLDPDPTEEGTSQPKA